MTDKVEQIVLSAIEESLTPLLDRLAYQIQLRDKTIDAQRRRIAELEGLLERALPILGSALQGSATLLHDIREALKGKR